MNCPYIPNQTLWQHCQRVVETLSRLSLQSRQFPPYSKYLCLSFEPERFLGRLWLKFRIWMQACMPDPIETKEIAFPEEERKTPPANPGDRVRCPIGQSAEDHVGISPISWERSQSQDCVITMATAGLINMKTHSSRAEAAHSDVTDIP